MYYCVKQQTKHKNNSFDYDMCPIVRLGGGGPPRIKGDGRYVQMYNIGVPIAERKRREVWRKERAVQSTQAYVTHDKKKVPILRTFFTIEFPTRSIRRSHSPLVSEGYYAANKATLATRDRGIEFPPGIITIYGHMVCRQRRTGAQKKFLLRLLSRYRSLLLKPNVVQVVSTQSKNIVTFYICPRRLQCS